MAACVLVAQPPILKPVKNDAAFTGTFLYPKDVTVPAEMVNAPPPSYPSVWRDRDVKGQVQIAYLINEKGRTEQVQVITANDEQFGKVAVDAVKKWRFRQRKKMASLCASWFRIRSHSRSRRKAIVARSGVNCRSRQGSRPT